MTLPLLQAGLMQSQPHTEEDEEEEEEEEEEKVEVVALKQDTEEEVWSKEERTSRIN